MALAYGDYHGLTHQLRFLLFEIGIACSHQQTETAIIHSQSACLSQLQQMATAENLGAGIISHEARDFVAQLKERLYRQSAQSAFFQWERLFLYVDNFIAHQAMILLYQQRWNQELAREMGNATSFWSRLLIKHDPHNLLVFLEQWASPYEFLESQHFIPSAFKPREVLQYAPQFNAQPSLHWCALRKQSVTASAFSQEIQRCFPVEYKTWQEKIARMQHNPDHFTPLPVHPWQWRNAIQTEYSQLIDQKSLLLVPHHQLVKPAMSPSWLIPAKQSKAQLELPLASQFVSGQTGSGNLQTLLEQANQFEHGLFVVRSLNQDTAPVCSFEPSLIENPLFFLKNDQVAVPFDALIKPCPTSGLVLITEMVHLSAISPLRFFAQYAQQFLASFLNLLLKENVSLMFSSGDVLLIIDKSLPKGIILKKTQCLDARLITEVMPGFINTILLGHLQPLLQALCRDFQLKPSLLWKIIKETLLAHLSENSCRAVQIRDYLFADNWFVRKRLSLRLQPRPVNESTYYPIANPLLG
ncbi:FrgA protein [Legionella birminghamensis]|uniref:FrgA protein n=1 Tax=Legionella birminghamensis TaxID=28083 RepID=A0A378I5T5_9GAMM|nr:IucA/IucC family protein [Legionella birminghamensis]KTC72436.1 FrgA protein [Legionella birminghamensis]STX30568.1 siderophore biosynthetic protein, iron repressed FrgA [Legionella birminghamensis]